MPISMHLVKKLHETLGPEAAEDLVSLIEGSESLRADLAELRHETQLGFTRLDAKLDQLKAELVKWSFVFWVGAVGAIAALAGVLR